MKEHLKAPAKTTQLSHDITRFLSANYALSLQDTNKQQALKYGTCIYM